ncbi:sortase [Pontibacillus chungwhensis BH030062]|uniref:Sortase n=1 Tax=Pontibacillus chungwhensis BH030062 TaxID=1385513 RepID=A0A0A2V840_9BACI|nr:class D sortase [Pontibacillus chungwhensis]KGP89850.1 sortase [Pontibacillus chungwhensis BH030062]
MKWISVILFVVGIAFVSYPKLQNYQVTNHQEKIIDEFENRDLPQSLSYTADSVNTMNGALEIGPKVGGIEDSSEQSVDPVVSNKVLGTLEIKKINVKLPILQGATQEHLEYGIGQLMGDSQIGAAGNVALAAHRGYTYGRLFNRLDELRVGDELIATTSKGAYRYHVIDTFLVLPNDLSVLEEDGKESFITLITCHPIKDPTHRLIVQAVLVNDSDL